AVRILRAWLQPLYNNQQVKNMEMIVMDEHNTMMQATVRMDKLKRFQHHLKEDVWGTKLYLFDGNKAIYEDEYKEVEECRQRLFANQPSDQSENTATKISTASKNSTNDTFVNKHPIQNIAELLDVKQDETRTMSLSLFNDEVQAMIGRSAYQLCEKYAKDNEATSNTVQAITSLDLESQTDENTTSNEKQKTNKRPAEGEPGSESSLGKKKAVEIKVEKDA
nr:nucleic acid-binding, OB-fold protein [Tanacetum cinerariifolium]